jgi:hypothetical protein
MRKGAKPAPISAAQLAPFLVMSFSFAISTAIVTAAALMILLRLIVYNTKIGTAMRAVSYDHRSLMMALAYGHRQRIVLSRLAGATFGYRELTVERLNGTAPGCASSMNYTRSFQTGSTLRGPFWNPLSQLNPL